MLEFESTSDDGIMTREPLTHAYARRWAAVVGYTPYHANDVEVDYTGPKKKTKDAYQPAIYADRLTVRLFTPHSRMILVLMHEPTHESVDVVVGMWGEALPERCFESLCDAVADLPYSVRVVHTLRDRATWLDENPMYRGLPGIAAQRESPAASVTE